MIKLFVGSLPWATRDADLEQLFSNYGKVLSAKVLMDRATGRSRGFGFVEMENEAEGQSAIKALHDSDFQGRKLVVNEARPREER